MNVKYDIVTFELTSDEIRTLEEAKDHLQSFFDDGIPDDFTLFTHPNHITIDSRSVMAAIRVIDAITCGHNFRTKHITVEELYKLPDIHNY